MERQQFTFYESFFKAICSLPKKDRLAVYEAICGYALYQIDPELDGPAASIFILTKPVLDKGRMKAQNRIKSETH